MLVNALDVAAGPDWNADTYFDVRLQDVPLPNRRPDIVVYRADTIDITPTRIPVVYTYLLDSAIRRYRDGDVYTGLVKATVPFPVEVDLSTLA